MQCSHFSSKLVAAAWLASLPALVYAQTPLQLNVPYSCQDGVTRTITRCEKNARAEVCFWREEQNGQVNERYNVRGQMDGWLATCKVQAAPGTAAPAPGPAGQAAASRPGQALNPPYLSEFPPVDRILRDIHADDPPENAARQMGALLQMNHIIEDLSEGRAARNQLTYDETVKLTEYKRAQSYILDTLQDKTARAARGYDSDLNFRQELLKRYFSPALQAQWARANARVVTANPSPPARPAPASAKPAVGPPDPGIAKARAANVDTKVFGIPLGEPLALPECDLFGRTPRPCVEDVGADAVTGLIGALFGGNPNPQEGTELTLALSDSSCPTWMTGCIFAATIQNGRLVAARLNTKGRDVEKAVAAELRGKYGSRVSMQQRIITPDNGSKEFDVWDLDWELPGLHVEYKVLDTGINDGYVRIESESLYEARKAKAREAARPKL